MIEFVDQVPQGLQFIGRQFFGFHQVGQQRGYRSTAQAVGQMFKPSSNQMGAVDGSGKELNPAAAVAFHITVVIFETFKQFLHRRGLGGPAAGVQKVRDLPNRRWPAFPQHFQHA